MKKKSDESAFLTTRFLTGLFFTLGTAFLIAFGSGGVAYDGATRAFTSSAFQTSTPSVNSVDKIHPNTLFANPFPSGFVYPPGRFAGPALRHRPEPGERAAFDAADSIQPAVEFLDPERSLATDMLLQVAYVGNKGTHLAWGGGGGSAGMNMLPPGLSGLGNQLLTLVNNPFYGIIPSGPLAQPQIQYGQLLLPFPAWQTVGADGMAIGNSEYDALQASYTKRFSKGLSIIAGYTWSKLITNVANGTWAGTASVRSYYRVRCEHSPSTYDVPHRFTLSAVGELPFGKGKMFGHSWNGVVDAVLGGWQANGILTLASGQPSTASRSALRGSCRMRSAKRGRIPSFSRSNARARPCRSRSRRGSTAAWDASESASATRCAASSLVSFEAIRMSVQRTWEMSGLILRTLYGLLSGETSPKQLMGPIAIAQLSGESAQLGWIALLTLMASISLNLGLLNLMPIPMLDGGHIFIMALEGLARRDFSSGCQGEDADGRFCGHPDAAMVTVIYNDLTRISWIENLMLWR